MNVELVGHVAEHRCVRPPVIGNDVVVWIRTDGVAIGATREGIAWEQPIETGVFTPLDLRVAVSSIGHRQVIKVGRHVALLDGANAVWSSSTIPTNITPSCADESTLIGYGVRPVRIDEIDLGSGTSRRLFERPNLGAPLVATRDMIVTRELDRCVAIDRASGAERWSSSLSRPSTSPGGGVPCGQPVRCDDLVAFPIAGYGVIALRLGDGGVAWEHTHEGGGQQTMTLHDGVLHMFDATSYVALDASTGAVRTSRSVTSICNALGIVHVGLAAFHERHLFAVDAKGIAFAYDLDADRIAWHVKLGARVPYACWPVVASDALWIMDIAGTLRWFSLSDP